MSNRLTLPTTDCGELTFEISGEPGDRWITVTRWNGMPYGVYPYRSFMDPGMPGAFIPYGDAIGCDDEDMALLLDGHLEKVQMWAESQALGAAAPRKKANN